MEHISFEISVGYSFANGAK
uniref:Uncharacterized protein n=1 Tax=Arundo donax TaxID=35708 RepID=A0A0A9EX46_ARUDO